MRAPCFFYKIRTLNDTTLVLLLLLCTSMALLKELDTMGAHSRCGAGGGGCTHVCMFSFSSFSGGDAHNEHYSLASWFEWIQKSWQRHALFGSSGCVPFPPMNKASTWTVVLYVLHVADLAARNYREKVQRRCHVLESESISNWSRRKKRGCGTLKEHGPLSLSLSAVMEWLHNVSHHPTNRYRYNHLTEPSCTCTSVSWGGGFWLSTPPILHPCAPIGPVQR